MQIEEDILLQKPDSPKVIFKHSAISQKRIDFVDTCRVYIIYLKHFLLLQIIDKNVANCCNIIAKYGIAVLQNFSRIVIHTSNYIYPNNDNN